MKKVLLKSMCFTPLITLSLGVDASEFIAPPMVAIPAGHYIQGSDAFKKTGPAKNVSVQAFHMARFPITVAEFRLFAKDTNYKPDAKCNDYMDENWMSEPEGGPTGSWDDHRYLKSEYQPVTCITPTIASQYAKWLSKKTGNKYRLPTEKEWEYALKAGSTSRYFWGDDFADTQVCKYGNVADMSGEYFASEEYGATYVGYLGYANCDDGEPYISITGLYRPNPFGLYDMIGNVNQVLSGCYAEGYAVTDDKNIGIGDCELFPHRTKTWHLPPEPHFERGRGNEKWGLDANMGFRLVADGSQLTQFSNTQKFEADLKTAQEKRLSSRPKLPRAPQIVDLQKQTGNTYKLSWSRVNDDRVVGYDIYRSSSPYSHKMSGFYKKHYIKIDTIKQDTTSISVKLPAEQGSFRVVTKLKNLTSLPSPAAVVEKEKVHELPGRVFAEDMSASQASILRVSKKKNDPEPFYISRLVKGWEQPLIEVSISVNVKESGEYILNYRGRSRNEGEFFQVWRNHELLETVSFDKDVDDKASNRHKVYLEKGVQNLSVAVKQQGWGSWSVSWLEFTKA